MNQEIARPTAALAHSARTFRVQLSSTRRGARLARLLAVEQLRSWDVPFETAGQLAANAVIHGCVPGRDFRLSLGVLGDVLRIEVTDTRRERRPGVLQPGPDTETGRGLLLVDALADRWGTAEEPFPRKTVWVELDVGRRGRTRIVRA